MEGIPRAASATKVLEWEYAGEAGSRLTVIGRSSAHICGSSVCIMDCSAGVGGDSKNERNLK